MSKKDEIHKEVLENLSEFCYDKFAFIPKSELTKFQLAELELMEKTIYCLENSIPKEKVKEKINKYREIANEDNREYFIKINTLQELLEEK